MYLLIVHFIWFFISLFNFKFISCVAEWQDERPPAPSYLRILYLGKILQDDDTLAGKPTRPPTRFLTLPSTYPYPLKNRIIIPLPLYTLPLPLALNTPLTTNNNSPPHHPALCPSLGGRRAEEEAEEFDSADGWGGGWS